MTGFQPIAKEITDIKRQQEQMRRQQEQMRKQQEQTRKQQEDARRRQMMGAYYEQQKQQQAATAPVADQFAEVERQAAELRKERDQRLTVLKPADVVASQVEIIEIVRHGCVIPRK